MRFTSRADQLDGPETRYPLRQVWCHDCSLSQIDYVVPGEVVFHPEYPYRSGITKELAVYQDAFVQDAIADLSIRSDELVVDIGSNDGTLLSGFKKRGIRVLGEGKAGKFRTILDPQIQGFPADGRGTTTEKPSS